MIFPAQLRRSLKCQEFGHLAVDYRNSKVITLEERKSMREEENQEEKKMQLVEEPKEELKEIAENANEGEILVLKRYFSSQKGVQDGLLNTFTISEQGKGFTLILVPIKPIPLTPNQDLSCLGRKLGQFTPPKQNPNPPLIH